MTQNPLINTNDSMNRASMYSLGQDNENCFANLDQSATNSHIYSHDNVVFNKRCGDCHGTGKRWRKVGLLGLVLPKVPCDKCYRASGVCLKCKGDGIDEKGQQCKYCLVSLH